MTVLMWFQDYKSIIDSGEPHLLLDVRPLVEVDICHLPFSLSILLELKAQNQSPISHFYVIVLLISSQDIPLSSLEERKSDHIRLLQERISQLQQQMEGDRRPPGNMSKHCLGFVHVVWNESHLCIFTVYCVVWYCRGRGLILDG